MGFSWIFTWFASFPLDVVHFLCRGWASSWMKPRQRPRRPRRHRRPGRGRGRGPAGGQSPASSWSLNVGVLKNGGFTPWPHGNYNLIGKMMTMPKLWHDGALSVWNSQIEVQTWIFHASFEWCLRVLLSLYFSNSLIMNFRLIKCVQRYSSPNGCTLRHADVSHVHTLYYEVSRIPLLGVNSRVLEWCSGSILEL